LKFQNRVAAGSGHTPHQFWLGMAQMFVATMALVSLMSTGLTAITLGSAALATMLTVTSRWLAWQRRRHPD
jgi:predicted lysophospholipase L1 biosynthesis ABC-type transport system permease subunit